MENPLEKNTLQFEDLIFDHVFVYTKYHRHYNYHYTSTITEINRLVDCVSGKFTSGTTTLLVSDKISTKKHFLQMLTGRIDQNHKTYGLVTYNGKERTWDMWKNTIKLVDFDEINLDMDINEYLKSEIRFKFPTKTEEELETLVLEFSKNTEETSELNLNCKNTEETSELNLNCKNFTRRNLRDFIAVFHTLLEPEILIFENVEKGKIPMETLTNFAKDKNAIVIVSEKAEYYNAVYNVNLNMFDDILQFKDDRILFHNSTEVYNAGIEMLYQMGHYSIETDIKKTLKSISRTTYAKNNMDVSTNNIDLKGIIYILRKKIPRYFTGSCLKCFMILMVIFGLFSYKFGETLYSLFAWKIIRSIERNGVYEGEHSFYMGCLYYMSNYWIFTWIISLLTFIFFEYFARINFSEDFLQRVKNPADFIMATNFSCNLPGYIFEIAFSILFANQLSCFKMSVIFTIILIRLIHFAIVNYTLLLFLAFYNNIIISLAIFLLPIVFNIYNKNPSDDIMMKILGIFVFALNPIYILDGIIEVLCFRCFINTNRSDGYFNQYISLRTDDMISLLRYYGLDATNFSADRLLEYKNLDYNDLFLVHNLHPSLFLNLIYLVLSILSVWMVTIVFGKRLLVQNIRLKLIGY